MINEVLNLFVKQLEVLEAYCKQKETSLKEDAKDVENYKREKYDRVYADAK